VLTTVAKARALGIDDQRWVFLHGYADLHERPVLERPDLGA
jgi:acetyl-CoA C-acetyltransferase